LRFLSRLSSSSNTSIVIGILLISLSLRLSLIVRGGQYYIADETRYEVSRNAARLLVQGQWGEAIRQFTISPEHLAFKVIGLIPALMEQLVGPSLVLPALFFSFFSVLNLYLIFLLSHYSQVSSKEPLYALLVAGSCLCLLYYSRHLFPYDMAMSFGLLALYVGVAPTQSLRSSLLCGILSFICFITYNGYWTLAAFAMLANVLMHERQLTRLFKRTMWTATGFLVPLALLIGVMLVLGTNMISAYRLFATSITQGAFEEGWSLPFAYFWHTEHIIIAILGLLSVYAIITIVRGRAKTAIIWAGGILFIYLCLLIPSVFLHSFVVYARLARQLIPFIILLAAHGIGHLEMSKRVSHSWTRLLFAIMLIQALFNFSSSYRLYYPRQFSEELQTQFRGFTFSTKRLAYGAPVLCHNNGYVIENAKYFLSAPEAGQAIQGELLRQVSHPVNFLPYQYEGYTPEQRQGFREQQLKMKFYKVSESDLNIDIKNCAIRGEE
jgi:hypothetical protein